MKLIICEKPSVAMEYGKILKLSNNARKNGYLEEGEWIITWAVGHLVSLAYPEAYDPELAKWRMDSLPFIPETFKYQVIQNVKEQFKIVKSLLQRKDLDIIYNAGDSGREGEYIQRLIFQEAKPNPNAQILRIWIDSTTEEAILNGIRDAKPASEYDALSDAAYERGIEDYLSGINFSRAYSLKYGTALNRIYGSEKYIPFSVGRVMTCTLGLVVQREMLIRNYKAEYTYGIDAIIDNGIHTSWYANENSQYHESPLLAKVDAFYEEEPALRLCNEFTERGTIAVSDMGRKIEKKSAPSLFSLAELQGECSKKFKISPTETLDIAQSLYEKKLTTYPRTDARVLSSAVAKEIAGQIQGLSKVSALKEYTDYILSSNSYANIYNDKKYVDDSKITDHYAIIPTGNISEIGKLSQEELQVYDLICRRFLAIFYPPLETSKISVIFTQKAETFKANASMVKSLGWKEVMTRDEKDMEEDADCQTDSTYSFLSKFAIGDTFNAEFSVSKRQSTKPSRYTSGNLILAMENAGKLIEDAELRNEIAKDGIGTSATRAETINKLLKNQYIQLNSKTQVISPTELGEMIYCVVSETISSLLDPTFTANWEKGLSQIVSGKITAQTYRSKITDYIRTQTNLLKNNDKSEIINQKLNDIHVMYGGKPIDFGSFASNGQSVTGVTCPDCGSEIVKIPWGYKCVKYKDSCNFTVGEVCGVKISDTQLVKILTKGKSDKMKFKKKDGKTFEASLKLEKNENGQSKLGFSFDNSNSGHSSSNSSGADTGCTCPNCHGMIKTVPWGFKCEKCKFGVGEVGGVKLTMNQFKKLMDTGETEVLTFTKKNNSGTYDAKFAIMPDADTGEQKIGLQFQS